MTERIHSFLIDSSFFLPTSGNPRFDVLFGFKIHSVIAPHSRIPIKIRNFDWSDRKAEFSLVREMNHLDEFLTPPAMSSFEFLELGSKPTEIRNAKLGSRNPCVCVAAVHFGTVRALHAMRVRVLVLRSVLPHRSSIPYGSLAF